MAENGLLPARLLDADGDGRLSVADARHFEARAAAAAPAERTSLSFAAQQARIGAALLPDGPTANPDTTVAHSLPGVGSGRQAAADVRRGIESLNLAALRGTGARLVSTFDFDSTIATGEVLAPVMSRLGQRGLLATDDRSFRAVIERFGIAGGDTAAAPDANRDAQAVMRTMVDAGTSADRELVSAAFFASASALRGVPVEQARSVAREVLVEGAPELGLAPLRERLIDDSPAPSDSVLDLWHAADRVGVKPWMVTFGFEWIAREAAVALGVPPERVVGWAAEARDGRFTGHSPHDTNKLEMIRERIGTVPILAVGDTRSDLTMLDVAVGRGVVVNPSATMLNAAHQRDNRLALVDYGLSDAAKPAAPAAT